jgi:hypothetical protein
MAVHKLLRLFLDFRRRSGKQERIAVIAKRLSTAGEGRAKDWLALDDIRGVLIERDVVDVEVRVQVVAEIGAGIEPEIKYLPEPFGTEIDLVALVNKADYRDMLVAKRTQETLGHGADVSQAAGAAISASRQIVECFRRRSDPTMRIFILLITGEPNFR